MAAAFAILGRPLPAGAQRESKVHRIGYLNLRDAPVAQDEAFLKALRELGYVEGRNLIIATQTTRCAEPKTVKRNTAPRSTAASAQIRPP